MKTSIRPLFGFLIIVVFIGTFSCRTLVRRGLLSIELENRLWVQIPAMPALNGTLLKYAAVDIGEEKARKEIQDLLDGNFGSQARHRTFVSWRRFIHHEINEKEPRRLPATIRSPLFYRYWLDFRMVLND